MRILKHLFWIFLVIAAFVYGFVFGSDQITMADVQSSAMNALDSVAELVTDKHALQGLMAEMADWIQAFFEKAYSFICFFANGVV